jgi:hypothetical protein
MTDHVPANAAYRAFIDGLVDQAVEGHPRCAREPDVVAGHR